MDRWLPLARFVVAILGTACVALGLWMWWPPAGLMGGGALLITAALIAEVRAG